MKQVKKEEWQRGDFIVIAMISRSAEDLIRQTSVTFEEFIEDGLGRARAAGFLTHRGKQFSIVEYRNAPSKPTTYILSLNHPSTMTDDLKDILEGIGLRFSQLAWTHADVEVERLKND
jgi:hypothetical protein